MSPGIPAGEPGQQGRVGSAPLSMGEFTAQPALKPHGGGCRPSAPQHSPSINQAIC